MTEKKEEIMDLEFQLVEAIKSGNIEFLETYLHDDLLFITPNGQAITKEMDLASHRSGQMVVENIELTFDNIKSIDDTFIVVVVYKAKGVMLGTPIEGEFRYIRFWKQFLDGFKIIGGSCHQIN